MYKVYFHVDESANAYLDGIYAWEEALKRRDELLLWYPSVEIVEAGTFPALLAIAVRKGTTPMPSKAVRALVEHLVRCEGKKGNSQAALQKLHSELVQEARPYKPGHADETPDAFQAHLDAEYVGGYLETPASVITDAIANNRKIRPEEIVKPRSRKR